MASTAPAERKGLLEDDDEEDEPRLPRPLTCWAVASDYLTLLNEERDFSRFLLLLCLNGVLYASFLPFLPIFVSAELQLPQSFSCQLDIEGPGAGASQPEKRREAIRF